MYPPIGETLSTARMDEIRVYIAHLHNTVAQYIGTCNIMDLCLEAESKPGLYLYKL